MVHRLRLAALWRPQTCSSLRQRPFRQFSTNGKSDGYQYYFWEKRPAIGCGM